MMVIIDDETIIIDLITVMMRLEMRGCAVIIIIMIVGDAEDA